MDLKWIVLVPPSTKDKYVIHFGPKNSWQRRVRWVIAREDENVNFVNFLKRSLTDNYFPSIMDKIFETNFRFHVK